MSHKRYTFSLRSILCNLQHHEPRGFNARRAYRTVLRYVGSLNHGNIPEYDLSSWPLSIRNVLLIRSNRFFQQRQNCTTLFFFCENNIRNDTYLSGNEEKMHSRSETSRSDQIPRLNFLGRRDDKSSREKFRWRLIVTACWKLIGDEETARLEDPKARVLTLRLGERSKKNVSTTPRQFRAPQSLPSVT